MKVLIGIVGVAFLIFIICFLWKYILPEKVKDTSIGCLVMIGICLFIIFQIVGIFHTCSNDSYYERDPYDDARK